MMALNLRGVSSREVMGELREMLAELYPQGILDGEEDLPGAAEQHAIAFGRQRLTVEEPLRDHRSECLSARDLRLSRGSGESKWGGDTTTGRTATT